MARTKKTLESVKEDSEVIEVKEEDSEETKIKEESSEKEEKQKKESKIAKLKEKAKALEKGMDEVKEVSLKKRVKPQEEGGEETLVPIEDYLKSSIHLGTRVITPEMRKYVYKRRADGLAVFNTSLLDIKLREGIEYLKKFAPEDVIFICKREAGWKAAELFSKSTGIKVFTKKYPAGILTNTTLENFMETELVFIVDPWLDKNSLNDALRIKIPVLSICDTNNYTQGVTKIIPGNNKSPKSIGMILYLLAKHYVESRKLEREVPPITEWIEGWETLVPPK